jgi:hypothetical protein
MRFLSGVLFGILLTVFVAYISDSRSSGTEPPQRMVNWDVVGEKLGDLTSDAKVMWDDFTREVTGPP